MVLKPGGANSGSAQNLLSVAFGEIYIILS